MVTITIEDNEEKIINLLSQAWNEYLTLPELHKWDKMEFMRAIHQAQNIILARASLRLLKTNEHTDGDKWEQVVSTSGVSG